MDYDSYNIRDERGEQGTVTTRADDWGWERGTYETTIWGDGVRVDEKLHTWRLTPDTQLVKRTKGWTFRYHGTPCPTMVVMGQGQHCGGRLDPRARRT